MVAFGRRLRWTFLTFTTSLLSANFLGPARTPAAQQSQQLEVQDSRTSAEADFDAFLDAHPEIDAQLRTNPWLIKDQKWLQDHREVLAYFDQHPQIKKDIAGSPSYLIRRESRRISREARDRQANLRKEDIASFQQFLDSNPQIGKQVRANLALIKEPRYVNEHPGLQAYLYEHPLLMEDLRKDPGLFLQRQSPQNDAAEKGTDAKKVPAPEELTESRVPAHAHNREQTAHDQQPATENAQVPVQTEQYERRPSSLQASPASAKAPSDKAPSDKATSLLPPQGQSIAVNPVLTASEIATFDQFLGEHKKVNQDLERKPERLNDTNYLKKHKDLQDYLNQHTGLHEELTQHAAFFMNRRNRRELSATQRTSYTRSSDSANPASSMPRLSQLDLRAADRFLEKHKNVYRDLQKTPSLAGDAQYLKKHKGFGEFLEQHPDINAAMKKGPAQFMQNQHDRFEQMHQKM